MKTLFKTFSGLLFVFGLYFNAAAQQIFPPLPEAKRPHVKAVFTSEKITIDGKDDEAVWRRSEVAGHFTMSYPKQGGKATYDTEVRLLYDNSNIYLFVKCDFPPGK